MLKIEDLRYQVGGRAILNGVTADFRPGLLYVIVGPNGSGKSTLLKTFSGEIKTGSGTVTYDGIKLSQISSKKLPGAGQS